MSRASQAGDPLLIKAVLFDLDGTLVDTAPDLIAALNLSLAEHGYPQVMVDEMRQVASDGSLALVSAAQPNIDETKQIEIQQGLLHHYARVNGKHSQLFDGILVLLDYLDDHSIPYGIVTNKPARFTRPLLTSLELTARMKTVISGDSTLMNKPKPAPMLLAAQQIICAPEHILYLGDAERDLVAAANTNMLGGIAMWGYIAPDAHPQNWPSNFSFQSAQDVVAFLMAERKK
ncbi:HAD-IA family hydrolase [Shewanella sp. D64]|uniref:HAD family hydrolase n=1 Tax=unclassified Shewanella TaxID=196818 RepID=UPI0022BA1C29|nr:MULTISPECIES: HAD-IA family hydrolase [unclassified Shewanella]MEC4724105.1 HAD-IA family hydrolase [Shewanella sp. D64]MEC4736125.1 HAD-IA family hydrolase [Shewanella sp. E94]WBJ97933.1 HAD-IA family hydrolase [Shewanella sp. MTB7]